MDYRRDIDGLRAVAVLSVLVFHAVPDALPGGWGGVDIFYVISGYLISSIILSGLRSGSFSFVEFYASRARRILPALVAVLIASWIAGWFLLLPQDFRSLGVHILSAAAFVPNLTLWSEVGYFDASAKLKPLLHLWSLGVEGQFYLVWPAVMILAFRLGRVGLAISAIVVLSFLLAVASSPSAAFFLPWNRFWELGVGAILASAWRPSFPYPNARSAAGLILIGAGLLMDVGHSPWVVVLPVAGAALLISAPDGWGNRNLLALRPMIWIGLISYPLYLWHWPLLVFARHWTGANLSPGVGLALVAVAFPLAILTYRLIEQPVRRFRLARRLIASTLVALAILGIATEKMSGFPSRFTAQFAALLNEYAELQNYPAHDPAAWRNLRCFLDEEQPASALSPECVDGDSRKPLVMFWGDSHAAQLLHGLRAIDGIRLAQVTASVCPPVVDTDFAARPNCRRLNDLALKIIAEQRPHALVVTARWTWYSALPDELLKTTLKVMKATGTPRIILVGPFPSWDIPFPKVVLAHMRRSDGTMPERLKPVDGLDALDARFRKLAQEAGVDYVSPRDVLCNAEGCETKTSGQVHLMFFDDSHLTQAGSVEFVRKAIDPLLRASAR